MARPLKKGLSYFPFDVGFYEDKKIRVLRSAHGVDGVELYLRLLCGVYRDNGYYLIWNDEEDFGLMSDDTGFSEEKVRIVIDYLLKRSMLVSKFFESVKVITSRSIQLRYFEAIKSTRMKSTQHTFIEKEICLLTEDDLSELNKLSLWLKVRNNPGFSENNPSFSENNSDYSKNNPCKEEKNKENDIKENGSERNDQAPLPFLSFQKVVITNAEHEDLFCKMGAKVLERYLTKIDMYVASKGKHYSSHYATLIKWWSEDGKPFDDGLSDIV